MKKILTFTLALLATTCLVHSADFVINNCPVTPVREEPSEAAEQATQLLFGEVCEVVDHLPGWTKIRSTMDGQTGWVSAKMVTPVSEEAKKQWGDEAMGVVAVPMAVATDIATGEKRMLTIGTRLPNYANGTFIVLEKQYQIDPSCVYEIKGERLEVKGEEVVRVAKSLLNVPYLWGGKNMMGFDCSGFVQTVYSVFGIQLLRNAREQITQGEVVNSLAESQPGDLVFFDHSDRDPNATKISHVGMLISPTQVIHCSGCVHIDRIDEMGVYLSNGEMTHHLVQIKRYL
ncbi:MAG: C40 family peptidase [Paludibacteraceae bacterium]|nr:C40 family peptidase [Paludibacteraceae bacterium]